MARPQMAGLTEHELSIMRILWKRAPLTVSEILEHWPRKPKPAYTSLLTAVRAMDKKGYLKHAQEGKAYFYSPVLQKGQYRSSQLKRLIGEQRE